MTWASFAVSYYCLSPTPTPLSNFAALRVLGPVASRRSGTGLRNPYPLKVVLVEIANQGA
jgi:hypothetical protein